MMNSEDKVLQKEPKMEEIRTLEEMWKRTLELEELERMWLKAKEEELAEVTEEWEKWIEFNE
jgi:hypothetical protein